MRLRVTIHYLDGRDDTYEASRLTTERQQWRLDQGRTIVLVPMKHVRAIAVERLDWVSETP